MWIDTDELFVLDPMVDDFSAPKADRALTPETIEHNALWHHLQAIRQTGHQQATSVCDPAAIETFLETLADTDACLTPNTNQQAFIRAVDRAIVPLQGPPGTGKTSGAIAPALLARAHARAHHDRAFLGLVVAPSHEAVDAVLDGVVDVLADWRAATGGLADLDLVRVLPTTPPAGPARVDAATPTVDVTYCPYHTDRGQTTLQEIASDVAGPGQETAPRQCLLFVTPTTLYRVLGEVAAALPVIDGTSAPAAMRHDAGLADVVCIDEASMLDVPGLVLAGSAVTPAGQTLVVGDHRQLATVTAVEWAETLRKPIHETQAHRSALDYLRWLNATVPGPAHTARRPPAPADTDGQTRQTTPRTRQPRLSGGDTPGTRQSPQGGGDR